MLSKVERSEMELKATRSGALATECRDAFSILRKNPVNLKIPGILILTKLGWLRW